jgi:hypothetical protein
MRARLSFLYMAMVILGMSAKQKARRAAAG